MDDAPILRRLARVASPFGGCCNVALLDAAGIDCRHRQSLILRAALTVVTPTVFLVGGDDELSQEQLRHAGLLLAGTGAWLGGASGLAVRGAVREPGGKVFVVRSRPSPQPRQRCQTVLKMRGSARPGEIVIDTPRHHSAGPDVNGWPAESVASCMRQLAGEGCDRALPRAWREADFLGLLSAEEIRGEFGRGRPGAAAIRRLLAEQPPRDVADRLCSRAELTFLQALLALGVPRPRVNARTEIGGRLIEGDFYFQEAQLMAEVDGPHHDLPTRRAEDELRDRHLAEHGVEVVRFTDDAVDADASACAGHVARRRSERIQELAVTANPRRPTVLSKDQIRGGRDLSTKRPRAQGLPRT